MYLFTIVILAFSILLQFAAAGLALALIRKTGRIYAWLFLASAILLMGVRRSMSLINALVGNKFKVDPFSESLALVISILMLLGVVMIASVFDQLRKLHHEVEQDLKEKEKTEAELQKSEGNLRAILNSISDAVIATNTESNVVQMNPVAERLTGWKLDEAKNKPLAEIFNIVHDDTRDAASNPVKTALSQGNVVELGNHIILISKDGTEYNIADSAAPIKDKGGNIPGVVLVFRDVTEKMKTEQELFKAKKMESIGVLAGGIAHDFNNILTGLFGNIELAKMKLPKEHEAYHFIDTANQALERATHLTKQLLTFARGGDPILEVVNLEDILKASINFNLSGSNVKANFNIPDNLWQIIADRGQISQVITNLTINAIQAMPDGGSLYIEAENIKDIKESAAPHLSGDFVRISMRDEGVGISVKYTERIFDPYFSTKQTGSGLGLATVHSIISKHNGHICVDSTPDVGTTFTIFLQAMGPSDTPACADLPETTEKPASAIGRILVMDDEEIVRDVLSTMLESFGYTIDIAVDGKDAIEKYKSAEKSGNRFDVVIMDLTIPGGKGGKEAVRELLAVDPEAKVIASSGYSTDPILANYRDYGFMGRIVKPFQMETLRTELRNIQEKER